MSPLSRAALALACLSACACTRLVDLLSEDPTRKSYEARSITVSADAPALHDAVARYAGAQGWTVDEDAPARVVAHVERRFGADLERDTWVFDIRAGRISVRRRLSLDDGSGRAPATSELVCGTYAYALEGFHLASIAELAVAPSPRQVAMRRGGAR